MKKILFQGAFLLALSSLASRLLGILRANRLAAIFGTGQATNAYFAAFTLPDFLYSVLVYGAVSAAFVPLFTNLKEKDHQSAWNFTGSLFLILASLTALCGIILFLLAPQFVSLLYPGFDSNTQALTSELLRILVLSPVFFSVSALAGSVQTALGHFRAYALAPLAYNTAIILGIILFKDIHAVAYATVFGAFLHALIQFSPLFKHKIPFRIDWSTEAANIKNFFYLGLPRIFAILTTQINILVDSSIASLVPFGSLAIYRYAQDINSFPLGIIGLSVATSTFGLLAALSAQKNHTAFYLTLRDQLHKTLFFIIPSIFGLILLRTEITAILLHGGSFTEQDVILTSNTLACLAIGLLGSGIIPLLSRAYYSQHNTRTPLNIGLIAVGINLVGDLLLYQLLGIYGLALASSLSALIQAFLLLYHLNHRNFLKPALFSSRLLYILASSILMSFLLFLGSHLLSSLPAPSTWLILAKTLLLILLGSAAYFLSSLLFFGKQTLIGFLKR